MWTIVVDGPLSGEENMRRDAALLAEQKKPNAPAVLRLFEWDEPTVTYGRLQSREKALRMARLWKAGPVAQRPTGGGMVRHHGDLSFSLVWGKGNTTFAGGPKALYRAIHVMAQRALNAGGVETFFFKPEGSRPATEGVCFTEPVEDDLMWNGQKVAGGALRVTGWGRLYQGNIRTDALGLKNAAVARELIKLFI